MISTTDSEGFSDTKVTCEISYIKSIKSFLHGEFKATRPSILLETTCNLKCGGGGLPTCHKVCSISIQRPTVLKRKDNYRRIREPSVKYIETHRGSGPEADGRPLANSQIGGCACYGTNIKVLSKLLPNDLNVGIKRPEIKAFEGWRLSVGATKLLIELKVQSSSVVLISPLGH